jgi:hypothetical protein
LNFKEQTSLKKNGQRLTHIILFWREGTTTGILGQEGNQRERAKQRSAKTAFARMTKVNGARLLASPKRKTEMARRNVAGMAKTIAASSGGLPQRSAQAAYALLTEINKARPVASQKRTELAIGEFAAMAETIVARSARPPQRKRKTSNGPTNDNSANETKTRENETTTGEKYPSEMANHGLNSVRAPEGDEATNAGEEERFRRGRRRAGRAPSFERTENDERDETRGMRSFFRKKENKENREKTRRRNPDGPQCKGWG